MIDFIPAAHAQAATGAAPGGGIQQILILVVFVVVFYFLLIRPQQKRAKEHAAMLAKLATGDEIVTAGGMLGRITDIGDNFATVEIADNVRVKIQRSQITSLVPKGTYKGA